MRHIKDLGTFTIIFWFILATFSLLTGSCTTSNHVSGGNQIADADFEIAAQAVPEGILLTFSNVPSDASYLWIHVYDWFNMEEPINAHGLISSYAGITDTSAEGWVYATRQLEKIKQAGKVIFPFVEAGKKYRISAMVYNQQDYESFRNDENFLPCMAETECVAENGVYFDRNMVRLELDKTNSAVSLLSEPLFSTGVAFDAQKYSYGITILVSETASIGIADHHIPEGLSSNGLTWTFEPQMTAVNLRQFNRESNWLENDRYYPAWAEARINIIYDDITWSVEIAKTPVFTYSL